MAIFPDFARRLLSGVNVKTPGNVLSGGGLYRLALYHELGRSDRSVLVISMTLQFQFEPADDGLKWFVSEQQKFADGAVGAIKSVWDDKWRITTTGTAVRPPLRDVGVKFALKAYINGTHSDDDFEVVVKKVPKGVFEHSQVLAPAGNAWLNSNGIDSFPKGASMRQRAVVHELGHMLGLRDEYEYSNPVKRYFQNLKWKDDKDSVMNAGELVQPRHYVPFATWLTEQLGKTAKLTTSDIHYKVDNFWDASNARL